MRNGFYAEHRKRTCEVEDAYGTYAANLITTPDQMNHLGMRAVQEALKGLRLKQRETVYGLVEQRAATFVHHTQRVCLRRPVPRPSEPPATG
jgi:hypothetical protein